MHRRTALWTAAAALCAASIFSEAAAPAAKRYQGTIDSISGRKVHMTMKDASTGEWTVAPNAPVTLGKKELPFEDVKPGYRATVWVKDDGTVEKLQIVSYPKNNPPEGKGAAAAKAPARRAAPGAAAKAPSRRPAPAAAAGGRLGEAETVQSNDGKTLVLVSRGKTSSGSETLKIGSGGAADIPPTLPVRAKGRKMPLSALKPGQTVQVRWNDATGRPQAIEVLGQ